MKILKPNEIGKGILIEYDAGHISMKNAVDNDLVNEQKSQLDTLNHLYFMLLYKSMAHQIEMVVYILKRY